MQEHLGGILTSQIYMGLIFLRILFAWPAIVLPTWLVRTTGQPLNVFYFLARKGLAQLTPEKLKSIFLHHEILRVTLNRDSRNKYEEQRSK